MTHLISSAGRARRAGMLRPDLFRKGLTVAALSLGLYATAFGNAIYTSSGFEEARSCAAAQETCVRNGRISDARQNGSEVASAFTLSSTYELTGLSWIGDRFDGDRFVFRLYGVDEGHPSNDAIYEYTIGTAFTTTPLVASPGFLSGWQLNADLAPIQLDADKAYFASLSVLGDATSILTYSWDLGQSSSGSGDFRRDEFTSGAWESAGPRVAAYRLSG